MRKSTTISKAPKLDQLADLTYCPNSWDMMLKFVVTMNTVLDVAGVPQPSTLKQQSMCFGEGKYAPRYSD
eukprot:15034353-Heterocapsa_arctica.AAC.1